MSEDDAKDAMTILGTLKVGKQTVIASENGYYLFTPEKSKEYYLGCYCSVFYYGTNGEKIEINHNNLELTKGVTYYFNFADDYNTDEGDLLNINLKEMVSLDVSKCSISMNTDKKSMKLLEGAELLPDNIAYTLTYVNGESISGTFRYDDESWGFLDGLYDDYYIFGLCNQNKVVSYHGVEKGKEYKICLLRDFGESEKIICVANNFTVIGCGIEDVSITELKEGTTLVKANDSRGFERQYYSFTPDVTTTYYFSDYDSAWYYDENGKSVEYSLSQELKKGQTYYFCFGANYETEYEVTINKHKKLKSYEIIPGEKTSFIAYGEMPLNDWKVKLTYANGETKECNLLSVYDELSMRIEDGYANEVLCTITNVSTGEVVDYLYGLEPGKYKFSLNLSDSNEKVTEEFTISQASEEWWKSRTVHAGNNVLHEALSTEEQCFWYRCEVDKNSTYTFQATSAGDDAFVEIYTLDTNGVLNLYDAYDTDDEKKNGHYSRWTVVQTKDNSVIYIGIYFNADDINLTVKKNLKIEDVSVLPGDMSYSSDSLLMNDWTFNIKYVGEDEIRSYKWSDFTFVLSDDTYIRDEYYNDIRYALYNKETGSQIDFWWEDTLDPGIYVFRLIDKNGNTWGSEYEITITPSEKDTHEHSYTSSVTLPATCVEKGVRTYTCECGDSYTEEIPIDKNNHQNIVTLSAKAATCTATGLTEGKQCNDCKTVLTAQKTIAALGHSFGNWTTTKAATVVATGVQTRTCSRCGQKETRDLAKLPSSGSLNATNFPLKVKQSATLKINGMAAGDRVLSWKSGNTAFATVDANGKVTGKKKGNTIITATLASGRVLTATVKVQTAAVKTTGITVNTRNVTLSQNQSFQLASVVAPFTSKDKLSYKTANKKIATVSGNGKITAKKAGKTTITVKSGKKSVKVTVNVIGVKTTGLSVNATQLNLKVKKKATIKANVTPKNTSEKVTYKTSNKKVATVDAKGKVTAKKAGTATITVTSGSKSVKVTVTVTK